MAMTANQTASTFPKYLKWSFQKSHSIATARHHLIKPHHKMSRGGRGGGPAGVGRMNGQALPFDVDTALEDQVALNSYQNDEWTNSLFPVSVFHLDMKASANVLTKPMNVHMAPPATAYEKQLVQHTREINEARRNSPFFLGDATGKRDASTFNAFEDINSYTNKKARRIHSEKPDLDNVPLSIYSTLSDSPDSF